MLWAIFPPEPPAVYSLYGTQKIYTGGNQKALLLYSQQIFKLMQIQLSHMYAFFCIRCDSILSGTQQTGTRQVKTPNTQRDTEQFNYMENLLILDPQVNNKQNKTKTYKKPLGCQLSYLARGQFGRSKSQSLTCIHQNYQKKGFIQYIATGHAS